MNGIGIIFLVFLSAVTAYFVHAGFKYTRMISNIFLSLVYRPESENFSSSMGEKMTILDSSDHEIETIFVGKPGVKRLATTRPSVASSAVPREKTRGLVI